MHFRSLLAFVAITCATAAEATGIPGLYRDLVPPADAAMTVQEYLSERYSVDMQDVDVPADSLQLGPDWTATAVANVQGSSCTVQLVPSQRPWWGALLHHSMYRVDASTCSPTEK